MSKKGRAGSNYGSRELDPMLCGVSANKRRAAIARPGYERESASRAATSLVEHAPLLFHAGFDVA